jgi:hypothetical protein
MPASPSTFAERRAFARKFTIVAFAPMPGICRKGAFFCIQLRFPLKSLSSRRKIGAKCSGNSRQRLEGASCGGH